MFFDYYGICDDWPGVGNAAGKKPFEVPEIIEPAITEAVTREMGAAFNPARFISYIQLHELESLLFAGPDEMAQVFGKPTLAPKFKKIVTDCGGCENINDRPETAPSKRIQHLVSEYKKGSGVNAHAYRIAQHIGMEKIRQECPNFNRWFSKLEQLG